MGVRQMSLKERLAEDMKEAMRARDEVRLSTIRLARAAIKNAEIEKGRELSDDEVVAVLASEAKRRREAIEGAERGGRTEFAARERQELEVLEQYLPEQIGEAELEQIVRGIIREVAATGPRDKGKVMSVLMPKVRGRADGRLVSEVVDRQLASS